MASSTMVTTAQKNFENWLAEHPDCTIAEAVRNGIKLKFLVLYNPNALNVDNDFVWRLSSYAKWKGVRAPVSLEKFVKDMRVKGAVRGKHYIVSMDDLYDFMGKRPPFVAEQPEVVTEVVTPTTAAEEEEADDEAVHEGEEVEADLPDMADPEEAAAQAEVEELVERQVEKMAAQAEAAKAAEAVAGEQAAKAAEAKKPKKKVCVFPSFHSSDPMVIILVL